MSNKGPLFFLFFFFSSLKFDRHARPDQNDMLGDVRVRVEVIRTGSIPTPNIFVLPLQAKTEDLQEITSHDLPEAEL